MRRAGAFARLETLILLRTAQNGEIMNGYINYVMLETNRKKLIDRTLESEINNMLASVGGQASDKDQLYLSLRSQTEEKLNGLKDSFRSVFGVEVTLADLEKVFAKAKGLEGMEFHIRYREIYTDTVLKMADHHIKATLEGREMPDFYSLAALLEDICSTYAYLARVKLAMIPPKGRVKGKYLSLTRTPLPYGGLIGKELRRLYDHYFKQVPTSTSEAYSLKYFNADLNTAKELCRRDVDAALSGAAAPVSAETLRTCVSAVKGLQTAHAKREVSFFKKKAYLAEEATCIALRDRVISYSTRESFYAEYNSPVIQEFRFGANSKEELLEKHDLAISEALSAAQMIS